MEMLKAESAYDAELFIDQDAGVFARVFGADAVIFSVIDTWQKQGFGIRTNIRYIIKSTATNEVLFERQCDLYLDLEQNSGGSGLLSGLIDLAASAIATAATDHIEAARKANYYIFKDQDLDNDNLISSVVSVPTYKRKKSQLEQLENISNGITTNTVES